MVPDDHDIGAAVAVDNVREPFAVRASRHVIHAVAHLIGLSQSWAAGNIIEAVRAFESILISFQERPNERPPWIIIGKRIVGWADAVIIRRPPDFLGTGKGCGRGELVTIGIEATHPRSRAQPITRQDPKRIVIEMASQANLVEIVLAGDAPGRS